MYKRFRIVILNIFVALHVRITFSAELQFDVLKKQRIVEKQSRGIMSPKMDYDEWTPIGRGDPLKNDPTFDYSPPMVGKVKYWINPVHRTPDPPIQLIKELTSTESSSQYTATMVNSNNFSAAGKPSVPSEIKRFYQDNDKESFSDNGTSYVQTTNSKYNNKFHKPSSSTSQIQQYQNQNHHHHHQHHQHYQHHPTRQPPLPSSMLVPPPPIEPNTYSLSGLKNSTTMELSWNNFKSHLHGPAITESTTYSSHSNAGTSTASISISSTITKASIASSTDKSYLKNSLGKEESETPITNPTTIAPLTPNPSAFFWKPNSIGLSKTAAHLIIQGHSKVKKYGGSGKLGPEKSSRNIDYVDEIIKYELPKETRTGKGLSLEDFLPINGALKETLKDIATNHAEGSGIGADLTKVLFPSYVRPSTTLVYESPRIHQKMRNDGILKSRSPIYSL